MPSIDAVNGMSRRDATRLRRAGVRTTEALLRRAATRSGRAELAGETGLPEERLLTWVHTADLLRIKGVGSQYAELLGAVGVGTVRDLRRRSPSALVKRVTEFNESKRLVRRLPTQDMVEGWVEEAEGTEPLVR